MFNNCRLCPRNCGINRYNKTGYCRADAKLNLARASLHHWEEPCISGKSGSGTVFFSGCQLGCVYCQNYGIAKMEVKKEISEERLVEIYFELQNKGANNINLVTPTHYLPYIISSVKKAKKDGLQIPFVYNCGGYESVESIKMLDGLIDIYLTDFKYMSPKLAKKYSNAPDYATHCKWATEEMFRQCGKNSFYTANGQNLMKKGVIVRHLVLPACTGDSKRILKYLYNTYGDDIYISIMSQYTPQTDTDDCKKHPELMRKITQAEYDDVVNFALELGIKNAYIQSGDSAAESFIPSFDYSGL